MPVYLLPLIFWITSIFSAPCLLAENGNTPEEPSGIGIFSESRQIISFVPQYLLNNGLRFDYDVKITDRHWLQFSPMVFYRENKTENHERHYDLNRLSGAGIHAYHRFYPHKGFGHSSFYISYGVAYQNYHILYDAWEERDLMEKYSRINKYGIDVIIGTYTHLQNNFILDFYAGLGFRHSALSSNAENPETFKNSYFEYGYSGNIMLLGLRIGLPF